MTGFCLAMTLHSLPVCHPPTMEIAIACTLWKHAHIAIFFQIHFWKLMKIAPINLKASVCLTHCHISTAYTGVPQNLPPPLENGPPGGENFLGFPGNYPPGGIFPRKICPQGAIFPRKNTPPPGKSAPPPPPPGRRFS